MSEPELCLLLDSILALLKNKNYEDAVRVIENGIKRIDKGSTPNKDDKK